MKLTPSAQQVHVLELYLALCRMQSAWNGSLLLGIGLNDTGRALALASLAVGAAGLFLEGDPAMLRQAQREGCCTFIVSTLEEAVRALKNEVRQGRGITLALSGSPAAHLADVVERGLQPQVVAVVEEEGLAQAGPIGILRQRGAQVLERSALTSLAGSSAVEDGRDQNAAGRWEIRTDRAATMADRRNRDRDLLAASRGVAGIDSAASAKWLRSAPSLFPRALDRAYLHDPDSI